MIKDTLFFRCPTSFKEFHQVKMSSSKTKLKKKLSCWLENNLDVDPPVCPNCGTEFNKRSELATHLAKTHTVDVFHCEQCDRLFHYNKSRFVDHIKNHNLEKMGLLSKSSEVSDLQNDHNIISVTQEKITSSHNTLENNNVKHLLSEKQTVCVNEEVQHFVRSKLKKKKTKANRRSSNSSNGSSSSSTSNNSSNCGSNNTTTDGSKNNSGLYPCEECQQSFPLLSKYDKHMIQHRNNGSNIVINNGKDDSSESDSGMKKDDDFTDIAGEIFRCDECGKGFKLKESLKSHQRKHTGEKPYICNVCNKKFARNSGLLYHLKHVHMGIKAHGCDICGRTFAMKAAMEDHRRIHTGERPYVCHSCGKSFKTRASLYIHSRTHTDEFPHPCTFCNHRFRWRQQLLGHLTIHTGEKNHICDVCGKRFGVKNDLTRHKIVHSDSKPFVCPICAFPFAQKRYLKNHMQSKHKVKYVDNCNLTE